MDNYYRRWDVRRTILDFARAGEGNAFRECAFFNRRTESIQRYLNFGESEQRRPLVFDSEESFELALRAGASAFYCSYWRYPALDGQLRPVGRDLVWILRAESGGLRFAKLVTKGVLEALTDCGLSEPWVKYSGDLGFDLILPLESFGWDVWAGSLEILDDVHGALTKHIASYLAERYSGFRVEGMSPKIRIKRGSCTCLLSELRLRRGLLLAPMSLNPKTGLVSLPIAPEHLGTFSVLDASPADAYGYRWMLPNVANGTMKSLLEPLIPPRAAAI
jgi:hypothetical protein